MMRSEFDRMLKISTAFNEAHGEIVHWHDFKEGWQASAAQHRAVMKKVLEALEQAYYYDSGMAMTRIITPAIQSLKLVLADG